MPTLGEALDGLSLQDGEYITAAPEGWTTGRTVYGGMTAALGACAAGLAFPGLPPLRSAQFTFIRPASDMLRFRATLLRAGRSATVVGVDCFADEEIASRATFTYGTARDSAVQHDLTVMPETPAPEACGPFRIGDAPPQGFGQYFDTRLALGERILSGGTHPEYACWTRLLDGAGADPVSRLLVVADSLPPAAMIVFPNPGMISTMSWSIDLAGAAPEDEWLLLHSKSELAADGYSQQVMEAWTPTGKRAAVSHQTVAIFV